MKSPKMYLSLALFFLFCIICTNPLNAQYDKDFFYLVGQIGTTAYHGDLTSVNTDMPFFHFGLSGGIGYVLSPRFTLRTEYRRGEYRRTERPSAEGYWRRHNAALFLTYDLLKNRTLTPYLLAGGAMTFYGTFNKGEQELLIDTFFGETFGPAVGLGVGYALSDRFSLTLEGKWDFLIDDEAMDEIKGDLGFDVMTYLSAGLRINLHKTFHPISGFRLSGPTRLAELEEGEYTASLIGRATEPVTYTWDFGDGTQRTGDRVIHSYTKEGTYEIKVTASNQRSSLERTLQVTVHERPVAARIRSISADDLNPEIHQTVQFFADVEGTEPMTFEWDFGDGNKSNELQPKHAYTTPGEYTVTFKADNSEVAGEAGIQTRTLTITVREQDVIFELDVMVNFDFDSSVLRPEAKQELDKAVEIIKQDPTITRIEVAGHTCDIGTAAYNKGLSERRARAVANYLIDHGVDQNRLVIVGYGEERPKVPNISIENRQQNRRVVMIAIERE